VRIACISDVHSNLEALTAALSEIERRGADAIYCLGDIVGYGADPAACLDLVQKHATGVVLGNHDAAVALEQGLDQLPPDGKVAALHNRSQLSGEQLVFLARLPLKIEMQGCTFVHASPYEPEKWRRVDNLLSLQQQFDYFKGDICFIGHTHVPGIAANRIGVLTVRRGSRFLINVGSVGQPRDRNPRLSFGLFDSETFTCEIIRVPYDVATAAAKIRAIGLPESLARRLESGR
jgi:diadenosine tetraphosphatase ApaH/serine/threonine PP2A family protein phosphatase